MQYKHPIYPDIGILESQKDFARKTYIMEETLNIPQEVMIKFLLSLPALDQEIISKEAQHVYFKDLRLSIKPPIKMIKEKRRNIHVPL